MLLISFMFGEANGTGAAMWGRPWALFCALAVMWLSCAPRATSTYPSYERTVARYGLAGDDGYPIDDAVCVAPDDCDCPRVWYRDHWVFDCDGRWIYWRDGYWYHYPHFHIYYYEGMPRVHRGSVRSIKKR